MSTDLPPRSRLRRFLMSLLRITCGILLGTIGMLYAFQTRMIFPGAAGQGTPESVVEPPAGTKLVTFKSSSGDRVTALFGPALAKDGSTRPDARERPTLLYFYGNGTSLKDTAKYDINAFRRLGVNMLIPDYVGYGMSAGSPSETNCYATADAAYDHLKSRTDIDPAKIILIGRSLGGAVAIDLASRREVAGLVVFSTFTTMGDMSKRRYPIPFLNVLLKHKFDSLSKMPLIHCPILIGHGAADAFVPATMSKALAAAAKGPVTYFDVPDADHNDFYQVGGSRIVKALETFIESIDSR